MDFYRHGGLLVQTAALKFTFYAELVASSLPNLFKLSPKEKNNNKACQGRSDSGGAGGEQRCTGTFGKTRLGPARQSERERDWYWMSDWWSQAPQQNLQGSSTPSLILQQTNFWTENASARPDLWHLIRCSNSLKYDVTTWAGPSWSRHALWKDRNEPGRARREEEKRKGFGAGGRGGEWFQNVF